MHMYMLIFSNFITTYTLLLAGMKGGWERREGRRERRREEGGREGGGRAEITIVCLVSPSQRERGSGIIQFEEFLRQLEHK